MTQPLFKEMRLCHITLAGVCQIIPLRLSCDCIVLCTVCYLLFYIARDFHFVGIVKVNLLILALNLVRANIFCRQSVLELNSCNYLEQCNSLQAVCASHVVNLVTALSAICTNHTSQHFNYIVTLHCIELLKISRLLNSQLMMVKTCAFQAWTQETQSHLMGQICTLFYLTYFFLWANQIGHSNQKAITSNCEYKFHIAKNIFGNLCW